MKIKPRESGVFYLAIRLVKYEHTLKGRNMKTDLLYLADSYQKEAEAKVIEVIEDGQPALVLDQTIFYAQGGGQPADHGTIKGQNGSFEVTHVSYNGGLPLHKGKLEGSIKVGDTVQLEIDWKRRYYHMQLHTAGHLLDQAVKNVLPEIKGVDGDHGIGKRSFVAFDKEITEEDLPKIQKELDSLREKNLKIICEMTTYEKLVEQKIELPFDLPKNKELRITQIGDYPAMPDGGTHLKSTEELVKVTIDDQIINKKGQWRISYHLKNNNLKEMKTNKPKKSEKHTANVEIVQLKLKIKEVTAEFKSEKEKLDSSQLQTTFLGKKGTFNEVAKLIKDVLPADKKEAGQIINELKTFLETEISNNKKANKTKQEWIDVTMPGKKPAVGHMHPVSQAMEEITHIFEQIGFTRVRYPEVDWDWYVFESLNMPPDHPARDEWETFFVDVPDTTKPTEYDPKNPRKRHPSMIGGKMVLTTHTSNGQVREMERLGKPPIRMINIARCYRRQQDATHTQMFHQFEGLVVDEGINIQHLKGTLDYFAEQFYGKGVKSRIRPFHFRFTEPSFEVDFSCHICHGTGKIDGNKCKFCKSGWHEVGGAGMVHPNVLKAGGIDPEKYTGFAFGWGIERTYTLKPGLNIDDIRLLYSGDMRFLEQF
jgi:phenylalanyl-tRNA synthetase alpha chain